MAKLVDSIRVKSLKIYELYKISCQLMHPTLTFGNLDSRVKLEKKPTKIQAFTSNGLHI